MTVRRPPSERGAALLVVLAMVLVLAGFTTLGLARLKAATADRSEATARAEAQLLAETGTGAARAIAAPLKARAQRQPALLARAILLAMPEGTITLRFSEGGACFNLNALGADPVPPGQARPAPQATPADLARLLVAAGIPQADSQRIAQATASALGSGLLWADASEWLTVPGVASVHWNLAGPLLCALPDRRMAAFSVNAIEADRAPLLVAFGLQPDEARRAIAARPPEGWPTANQFWESASPAGVPGVAGAESLGIASRWLAVTLVAQTPRARVERRLLLDTLRQPARLASSVWVRTEFRA